MVLNRLRGKVEPLLTAVARPLLRSGLPPTFWSAMGLVFSILSSLVYARQFLSGEALAGALYLTSGLMDALDGTIARLSGKVLLLGGFLDSVADRIAEIAVHVGILLGGYAPPHLILLSLAFSLLVSYVRAKGDSLNISLVGVGLGERAERIAALSFFSMLNLTLYGIVAVLVLSVLAFIERIAYAFRTLSCREPSSPP